MDAKAAKEDRLQALTPNQAERYARNLAIPEIGLDGQRKLLDAKILVIGAGGLGSSSLYYLSAAGVGTIAVADGDRVELSNLQRQILHTDDDIGRMKTRSAVEKLQRLNGDIKLKPIGITLNARNGMAIMNGFDFVVEASDNFETKFLVNDLCLRTGIPFSHAGISGLMGQTMTVLPGQSACYRCVFGKPPPANQIPTTKETGVLGAVAGVLGSVQAAEAIKYITGCGRLLSGRMLTYDALEMQFREIKLPPPSCALCRRDGGVHQD